MRPATLRRTIADAIRESELPRTLIAKDASLGRATIESWLSGIRNPSEESVAQIAAALDSRAKVLGALAASLRQSLERAK